MLFRSMGMIRGNADLGFGADPAASFGARGLIRENVDSRVGADAAARWSGMWTRSRNRDLGAAKVACRGLALRRHGGMISQMLFGWMLLEGMDMRGRFRLKLVNLLVIFVDIVDDFKYHMSRYAGGVLHLDGVRPPVAGVIRPGGHRPIRPGDLIGALPRAGSSSRLLASWPSA